MNLKILRCCAAILVACSSSSPVLAQTTKTWKSATGDFYDPSNWDSLSVPGAMEIALINNGGTATIAANAGNRALGTLQLGSVEGGTESGHVIMNGGFLTLGANEGDQKAVI